MARREPLGLNPPESAVAVTARAYCSADHPDPRRTGERCGSLLGVVHAAIEFVAICDRGPDIIDGTVWLHCPRRQCGKWNQFRIVDDVG